uniref:acyltransferase n=1 Tax=uncultured Polaribacter sp. TaxID=174711 RepID=UPI002617E2BB|nr:acyltransferase [uncultured Polaribacter sp.]
MIKIIGHLIIILKKIKKRIVCWILVFQFKKYGKNIIFDPSDFFSFKTIELGSHVYIGPGAYFSTSHSIIKIGSKVMFGPNVSLLGGNHNISILGKYMIDIEIKTEETDAPIILEDDVWIGSGVTILKGVTIGEGSVIAANSLVNKDVESYSIYAGIPAKKIKDRFTKQEIIEHKKLLTKNYPNNTKKKSIER